MTTELLLGELNSGGLAEKVVDVESRSNTTSPHGDNDDSDPRQRKRVRFTSSGSSSRGCSTSSGPGGADDSGSERSPSMYESPRRAIE